MNQAYFVTGTDTEVGKTYISTLLLKLLAKHGKKTFGYKPIAADAEEAFGELVNVDAISLMEAATVHGTYEQVNPFCFAPPIAPHIAAKQVNVDITVDKLHERFSEIQQLGAEYILCEGAGGWALPINDNEYLYDWVARAQLPVILVVGMKLGCLNHAFLTAESIKQKGLNLVGWIANQIDPEMSVFDENLESLKLRLDCPLLATAPYSEGTPKLQLRSALLELFELKSGTS
ncbi:MULTISPECIES: dethiobiotin synthase [Pseudoalteromonas]|uniref:dethiobiotin synthase n=1 Tax=Pseudoalteromonas TaxID=53246 RepID=UPI001C9414D9|nr:MULTISPECIES: dethiobiotin synthase [Pseudoalteromonas]MCG7539770.1 dethiobiotin synthase [Pseudoalteromonas sp. OF7H-1]QZO14580.1 dethiobiotin synthase [Pseudoalteromonas piscicida]